MAVVHKTTFDQAETGAFNPIPVWHSHPIPFENKPFLGPRTPRLNNIELVS
jgi:hypothetical protein